MGLEEAADRKEILFRKGAWYRDSVKSKTAADLSMFGPSLGAEMW